MYKALKPLGKLLGLIEPRDCPLWYISEELLIDKYYLIVYINIVGLKKHNMLHFLLFDSFEFILSLFYK